MGRSLHISGRMAKDWKAAIKGGRDRRGTWGSRFGGSGEILLLHKRSIPIRKENGRRTEGEGRSLETPRDPDVGGALELERERILSKWDN